MRTGRAGTFLKNKIQTRAALCAIVRAAQKKGKRVVFTNGCFDLLHFGHVKYLETARSRGDMLVVAVNSDASVRRLKGSCRPLVSQRYRASVVAALASVDYVSVFGEDTPLELIKCLKPDVLVKGADWKPGDIVGADVVKKYGGTVSTIVFEKGFSTTNLIKKIAHTC